jgi:hypothetical protein
MDSPVFDLAISEYTKLLVLPIEDSVTVELNTEVGQMSIALPLTATVAVVKKMIEVVADISMSEHKLMFNGDFLQDDGAMVAELGLLEGSIIYVS